MNATHQFFLTKRAVYVLVLDARKDDNVSGQIRKWVNRIKSSAGDSSIIVVSNQIDVNPGFGFENEFELKEEFPQIKYFLKVSCKTEENIVKLKEKLAELIPKAELFNTEIDERWLKVKDQLQEETKDENYLTETRFKEICIGHNLLERNEQRFAIQFLHDLGSILHFEHIHRNLSEYFVLDPYWITYGVYQIVTSKRAGELKGNIPMSELEFIVNEEEDKEHQYQPSDYKRITYSTNERRFLVDILHQFKLCFYTPDRTHFILPDLLDTREPTEITKDIREYQNKIQFIYRYNYLPKSVLPYFMVESNRIISERWRTGCVVNYNTCLALVSTYDNNLSIVVKGEHKEKRGLMSILRHCINLINTELGIEPKQLIPLPEGLGYVPYNTLLKMERRGRQYYDLYEPEEREFEISELLDGIEGFSNEKAFAQINNALSEIKGDVKSIDAKIERNFNYLMLKLGNDEYEGELMTFLKTLNAVQCELMSQEVEELLDGAFTMHGSKIGGQLKETFAALKQTDDFNLKLKLGLPLVKLLGVDLEAEFDVKSWLDKMTKKYGKRLMGVLL